MGRVFDISEERIEELKAKIKDLMLERAQLESEGADAEAIAALMAERDLLGNEQVYIFRKLRERRAAEAEAEAEAERERVVYEAEAEAARAKAEAAASAAAERVALNLATEQA